MIFVGQALQYKVHVFISVRPNGPKQNLTLYLMSGFDEFDALLEKLGKYKTAKSCLHIKSLDDIRLSTLKKLTRQSIKHTKKMYSG